MVAVALISVAIVSYHIGIFGGSATEKGGTTPVVTSTIIKAGSNFEVFDGSYRYIGFSLQSSSTLTGYFNSTVGITIYIILSSDNSSLSSHGVPLHYLYTTGHVEGGQISTQINAGSYDLMLANDNGGNSPSIVTFTTNFTSTAY